MFGKEGVCLITNTEKGGRGILMNNQYLLGSSIAFDAQRQLVLIPLLLHGESSSDRQRERQVGCLGLATGISAGAALDYDETCQVTAIEISPMVVAAAQTHFADENRGIVDNARSTVIVEDARTYVSAVHDKYDVIIGDLYRPYGAGEGRLFSVEHFRNVRQALATGGIYCQWIPAYQVTENQFDIIAATFLQAFPEAALLRVESESGFPKLGLLGGKGDVNIAWDEVETRCQDLEARGLGDDRTRDFSLVKQMYVGRLADMDFENVQVNTLNNARLEIEAGLHRVTLDPRKTKQTGADAYLQGENWELFSRRFE